MSCQTEEQAKKIIAEKKTNGWIGSFWAKIGFEIRYKYNISEYKKVYSSDGESGVFGKTNESLYIGKEEFVIVFTHQNGKKIYYIKSFQDICIQGFYGEIKRSEDKDNKCNFWSTC